MPKRIYMKNIIIFISLIGLLSSCSIYKKFESPQVDTNHLYRDTISADGDLKADSSNYFGNLKWNDVFQDPQLQQLIEQGLDGNLNMKLALLRISEADAALKASRLAFAPGITFAPNGAVASFDNSTSQTYGFPLSASWQVPLFGGLLNAKRRAEVQLTQGQAYKQAVQSQLVAAIASSYYTLVMLDKQLAITNRTIILWGQSLETMRGMKKIGLTNEAAITQSEASYQSIKLAKLSLEQSIRETENALSALLGQAPHVINRSTASTLKLPDRVTAGVPLQMLAARPDVKQAEMALAASFYATNIARSAFYPNITVNGTLSWTNNAGSYIVNPARLLESVAGSMTAPLFNRGANQANLKIANAQQDEALATFNQTIINAGNEVSDALFQYNTSLMKQNERAKQIEVLEYSERYTKELFRLSSSTYLEVLTAQQTLLSAQISETEDNFDQILAIIALYQALGGGAQ